VTPVSAGSTTVSPTATTTYTGTATGAGGTVTCKATVDVTPTGPGAPTCTLTAAPVSINPGDSSTLTWTTTNATSASIDQGIGIVTPVAGGSQLVTPASTTTYTLTAVGTGGTATCPATVTVTTQQIVPACTLTASPSSISPGGSSTLSWTSSDVTSGSIDNGVGSTTPVAAGSVNVTPANDTTYTATFTGPDGSVSCQAAVTIVTGGGGGGCTSGCGGGGGGGGYHPNVTLSVLTTPQPLAFVYLSQIPYTGLDLGPVGTVAYWVALVAWSLAVAYLILFVLLPYLVRRMQRFGADVHATLNANADVAPEFAAAAVTTPLPESTLVGAPHFTKSAATAPVTGAQGYSTYEGFRSFAKDGALTIDDIVSGLAREKRAATVEPIAARNTEPIYENVEPVYQNVEPMRAARAEAPAAPVAPEVPSFIAALLAGDRETVFASIRSTVQAGGDAEAFLTQVVCALDDAYRARTEGTSVHPTIASATKACSTGFLERLVTSLSTAIDSSYSVGITGTKLALTRALALVAA
jgi:hypothetical protein